MVKTAVKIVILMSLLGCSQQKPEVIEHVQYVEVPVIQEIHFQKPKIYKNYIKSLSDKSSPKEIAEAYVNTIKEMNSYIKKLETLINPFCD